MRFLLLITVLFTSACAVSNNPVLKQDGIVANDILAANRNLEKAVEIGVLSKEDPAVSCVRDIVENLGLGEVPSDVKSFQPERKGLISEGAVIWIRAQQLKNKKKLEISSECKAVIGQIFLDSAKLSSKGLKRLIPGSGLISVLRGK